jgi:hypothetical protein
MGYSRRRFCKGFVKASSIPGHNVKTLNFARPPPVAPLGIRTGVIRRGKRTRPLVALRCFFSKISAVAGWGASPHHPSARHKQTDAPPAPAILNTNANTSKENALERAAAAADSAGCAWTIRGILAKFGCHHGERGKAGRLWWLQWANRTRGWHTRR